MKANDYQALVLCGLLNDRAALVKLAPSLPPEAFEGTYQLVYETLLDKPLDSVPSLASRLANVGGLAVLKDLQKAYKRFGMSGPPSFKDTEKWSRTVEKLGRLRQVKVLFETALTTLGQETDLVDLNDDEFVGDIVSGLVEAHHNSRITGG